MEENDVKKKKINVGPRIFWIVFFVLFITLVCLSIFLVFSNRKNDNNESNTNLTNEVQVEEENNQSSMIEIELPSGRTILVNKEYKNIFNDNEKIIATSEGNFLSKEAEAYTSELTLTEFLEKELEGYSDDFYTGKQVSISSNLFDFDKDGINEIMFSFCEEYIILHYYDGRVYGYTLEGYRTNGNWNVEGMSTFSGSAVDWGYTKYTFEESKLISNIAASSEGDYSDPEVNNMNIIYKLNDEDATKDDFENFVEEQKSVDAIEFIEY